MDSKHLVDLSVVQILDVFPAFQLDEETLPQMRLAMEQMSFQSNDPDVAVKEHRIRGPKDAPDVRVLFYEPARKEGLLPAFLYLHGGGYVLGSPELSDLSSKARVKHVECAVVSVDYRLAPETPSPGPVEDCYTALKWLYENAAELGVDKDRIAIGGESAGGGLAAALALLARDRGEIPVIFQLLIYPMLDDRTAKMADPHPFAGEFIWTPVKNHFGWAALIGGDPGSDNVSYYTAPARAESLAGLPPAFISVGALDLFVEEDMEYARRLTRAGVPVELHVYAGGFHAFNMSPDAELTKRYERDQLDALRRALHP